MIIEGNSVAECWLRALQKIATQKAGDELSPLMLSINMTDEQPQYQEALEKELNAFLKSVGQPCIETTASTIFPVSLSGGKQSIYERYDRNWKYIKKDVRNRKGTYFRRFTSYGEKYHQGTNQLENIITTFNGTEGLRKPIRRRSALIATTFDPLLDHTPQPLLGFPCLQQVCFIPNGNETLSMNAIYAMQHLSTRAYGNYLGLIRLGQFMAKEMNLEFVKLNAMISVLGLGRMTKGQAKQFVGNYA